MNSLKKTYAFLLTTAMSVGLGVSSHYLAMDDEQLSDNSNKTSVDAWNQETKDLATIFSENLTQVRNIFRNDFVANKKYEQEKLYFLPLNKEPRKFMIVNETLTKCIVIYTSLYIGSDLEDIPIGYGNEIDDMGYKIRSDEYNEFYEPGKTNIFDISYLGELVFHLPLATREMGQLAKEKGIAGYKKDPTWWSYCVAF